MKHIHTESIENICAIGCAFVSEGREERSRLQGYIRELREKCYSGSLHRFLEKRYRDLTTKRQREIINNDEEEKLWRNGVLSSDSTARLLHAMTQLTALRGRDERHRLKISREVPNPDSPTVANGFVMLSIIMNVHTDFIILVKCVW